ncbi:MAG: MotA/TolQ/ExbB proton channel family protein [Cyclobacteriaceae bacterium]
MFFQSILLQATPEIATPEEIRSISLLELIQAGGWVMIPILLLAIIAIYLFFERYFTISSANKKRKDNLLEQVRELVLQGNVQGAAALCEQTSSPISRMIHKGILRLGSPLKHIEASIENVGKIEIAKLEKNLPILATISGAAPTIGFLGTVIGMIQTFIEIHRTQAQDISGMAGGIYEALITTAAGLSVGLLAYMAYNFLSTKIQKIIHDMEASSIEFLDVLQEPTDA